MDIPKENGKDSDSDFETVSYCSEDISLNSSQNNINTNTNIEVINRYESPSFYDAICDYKHINLKNFNKNFKFPY